VVVGKKIMDKVCEDKTFISTSLCRLLIVFIITGIFLSDGFAHYHNKWYEYGKSSQGGNVRENGRFSRFIFYNNQEKLNRLALHKYRSQNIDIHNILYQLKMLKIFIL